MIYFYVAVLIVIVVDYIIYRKMKKQIELINLRHDINAQAYRKDQERFDLLLKELGYEYIPKCEVPKLFPLEKFIDVAQRLADQYRNIEFETVPAHLRKIEEG